MIQRYSVGNPFGRSAGMIEDEKGEYILYDDYIKSLEKRETTRGLRDAKNKRGNHSPIFGVGLIDWLS